MNQEWKKYLAFSIILNLLFAGFFLGGIFHGMVGMQDHDMNQVISRLPEKERQPFMNALDPFWKSMEASHIQLEKEKEKAVAILRAQPFDANAYIEQIRRSSQLRAQQKLTMAQDVIALAKQFSPEQRAVLADIISRPPPYAACGSPFKGQ